MKKTEAWRDQGLRLVRVAFALQNLTPYKQEREKAEMHIY